ncbi:putative periplasmic binding abc transporter protein [Marinomonas sp. MED121]|uniref:transporter substrate-binding domain-containing protein n=1 Tax=Marinomonas sp. MED121 TaxID=314277 RepID=UPI00006904D3|nr:transporter substrate-binding domain-containing protein [Marinomonas sp. MED121]EAQ64776.1 putative periplasmic binding abc transporter protein [Marinomonas sp. MED121]
MKLKASIAYISAFVIGFFSTTLAAQTIKVGIATEPYPPFSVPDASGNYSGWEIDIAKAICAQAKLDCEIVATAWDGIIPALLSKKIDVVAASLSITADRKRVIDFSDKYYQSGASIIGSKNANFSSTPAELDNKIIGLQAASIHVKFAKKYYPNATIKEYQSQDEANQDLYSGRIDATQADALTLESFLNSEQGKNCCDLKGMAVNDESLLGEGIGFGLRKGNPELKEQLNNAIDAIRENGTYEQISQAYFSFNIYGE